MSAARCMLPACRSYFCEYIVLGVIPSYAIPSSRVLGVGSAVAPLLAAETERAVVRYSQTWWIRLHSASAPGMNERRMHASTTGSKPT